MNSCSIQWCAHILPTVSYSVLKWPKRLCTCNNAYLAQHAAAAAAVHGPGRLSPTAPRQRARPPSRACPACPGPLHPCTLPFAWAICPLQLCKNANNKHQRPIGNGDPAIPGLSHGTPHQHWISLHNSSLGLVVNFRPVLATKQPRTLCSGPARPSVQPGPAWPSPLPCPPAALQLQLPGPGLPFLAGLDGAHSLCAANCSSSSGRRGGQSRSSSSSIISHQKRA